MHIELYAFKIGNVFFKKQTNKHGKVPKNYHILIHKEKLLNVSY